MFVPYRAKNPPEHFPYVTLGLIAVNVVVFAVTSESGLTAREDVVQQYALSHETLSFLRIITSMFLHGSIVHLAGNMLFLWIFGAAVEGRVRPWVFLPLYLLCGIAGDLLHEVVMGIANPAQFSLGASGAIMGLAGAYLFVFPYSTICIFWWFYWRMGVMEWQARWVVLLYIGLDALEAVVLRGGDGVGHLAHLGGFGFGLLAMLLLRVRRDSEDVSSAQAIRAEVKDYSLLGYNDLHALIQQPSPPPDMVMAFVQKALGDHRGMHVEECLQALRQNATALLATTDPGQLAWALLSIPASYGGLHPSVYLRLGSQMESRGAYDYAVRLYQRIYEMNPRQPDCEAALYRMARLTETVYRNPAQARSIYAHMLELFPYGEMALDARRILQSAAAPY